MSAEVCDADEGRFQAVFACVPECVKRVDAEGRLIDINPAGLAMIDAAALDEVRGADLLGLIDPAYHSAFRDALAQVFAGKAVQLQFEVIGLKGRRLWMDQSAAPLFDGGTTGKVIEMVAVTRDITALRESEAALLRAKVAEEVARSKALFLANVGNDLKTPLGQILGYSELLKEAALDQGRVDDVADIERVLEAGSRLSSMLNQLLAIALEDARRQNSGITPFDLGELVEDALAFIRPVLQASGTHVAATLGEASQTWVGDGERLNQCLRSALSAASEFAAKGVIEIHAATVTEAGRAQLRLEISARRAKTHEEPVPRSSPPAELGPSALRLARDTARAMGGDIKVTPEPQGARFVLRVPAHRAPRQLLTTDAA